MEQPYIGRGILNGANNYNSGRTTYVQGREGDSRMNATQTQGLVPPPVSTGTPPAKPVSPAPAPKPPAALIPAAAPAAHPAATPTAVPLTQPPPQNISLTNPATHQTAPAIGMPTGYDITAGMNTSTSGLMPSGFSMSDLLSPTVPADAAAPSAAQVTGQEAPLLAGATPWNITAPQTVAGQYQQLMSAGNPAIQAAEQSTIRANAANGGNNSLMAQTAATLAGSQVALTIAQQDAQVNAAAGQYNATAANAFASAQNQFIQNASLSQQNFEQGVALLKDQTNQSMEQLYAQLKGSAVTASINLTAQLDTIKAQANATLEQMDKTFAQTTSTNATQEAYAASNAAVGESYTQANAMQSYGMNVRLSYLAAVGSQQNALMNTIASIQSNPNINTTQAQAGIKDAVDQFNSFMTMNNAYYASMVPTAAASNPAAYMPGFPHN
jgi:hypothetical protein